MNISETIVSGSFVGIALFYLIPPMMDLAWKYGLWLRDKIDKIIGKVENE